MFFKLVSRNSRRSRKENGLFFSSLVVSIIAFYIILSLANQDVMIFLTRMESDAVNKLLALVPAFYVLTLMILYFLIYFACKYQLERRSHEFGVYLMMGMQRSRLFLMLLAEDLKNSLIALAIGIPAAVTISEAISLITARAVGLGIIGHTFSFSLPACVLTIAGFLVIKCTAFLILSGKISRREIGSLLTEQPEGTKRQLPSVVYWIALLVGTGCLAAAYTLSLGEYSWKGVINMLETLGLGFIGTLLFFFGLRMIMTFLLKMGRKDKALGTFNFRQLQESIVRQSGSMAIVCMLVIAGLSCFGSGIAIMSTHTEDGHIMDYTFVTYDYEDLAFGEKVRKELEEAELTDAFSSLFEMRLGHAKTEDYNNSFDVEVLREEIRMLPDSQDKEILLNNFSYQTHPYLISLNSYNEVLRAAGKPEITLLPGQSAVYMGREFVTNSRRELIDRILEKEPEMTLEGEPVTLTGPVHTESIVTDRSINISFALIMPDDVFERMTQGSYEVYVNAVLREDLVQEKGMMAAITEMNDRLRGTELFYESYLQNMGRRLFYLVAASYLTIYLAVIFLIVANTVLGVQFLMNQRKTGRRYKTLVRLGADYDILSSSMKKQVNWYFGIPVVIGACNSIIASRALIPVTLSPDMAGSTEKLMVVSIAMILLLCVVEWIYMWGVKRAAGRYLLTVMEPEREE